MNAKPSVNEFTIKIANVNGTGSASANGLLMKSLFRMGIPVVGKNYFPSNIQGLPTWYEVRVSEKGHLARSGRVDIMVAMNAETYKHDLAEVASGGYLMASVANKIIAAPFAIVGSIGVLAQLPNFNRFLEERGVDFEQITAGKYKRTLTMFGKNTDEDREKTRQDLEEVHSLFKNAVVEHRPSLDIENVATGEYWYGPRARELGLIDEVGSSDDYLMRQADEAQIFAVTYKGREGFMQKLQGAFGKMAESLGIGPQLP